MSIRSVLVIMLARLFGRRRSALAVPDRGPQALVADDPTILVSPSQAVTVSIERPHAQRPSRSKPRNPLPWPARETHRLQRRSAADDAGPQPPLPPTGGLDVGDDTVVVAPAAKDEAQADGDATAVWRPGDAAGQRLS